MNDLMLQDLGCVEECGADVFGGELINPWFLGVAIGVTVSVCNTIINNWSAMKEAFAQGVSDGANSRI